MATTQPPSAKLGYTLREAAALTPWGYDRLRAFIESGELPAKRAESDDGKPGGKFVILHDDLVSFLQKLPAA